MNPFGPLVPLSRGSNGHSNANADDEVPHLTKIIHGEWLVVYSWPPQPFTAEPPKLTLERPTKLEGVLFGCRCSEEVADKLYPVKVIDAEKNEVKACELVDDESYVNPALDYTTCACRHVPVGEKIVVLPINENVLLHYRRLPNVQYTAANPNTCELLFNRLPSSLEIEYAIEGLEIAKRHGDYTFQIKQE